MAQQHNNFDPSNAPQKIKNHERGCGYLDHNSTYLRSDPELISEDGEIPLFVEFNTPVLWKNEHFRNWKYFNGTAWLQKHRDNIDITPSTDPEDHLNRLARDEPVGSHAGKNRIAFAHDILMHVGETHYEDPEDFISEAKTLGANKKLPKGNPPIIDPMRTRVFLVHPTAVETAEGTFPGIIGYFYPSRVVHTKDEHGEVSNKIQDLQRKNILDIVEVGQEISNEEQEHAQFHDFTGEE